MLMEDVDSYLAVRRACNYELKGPEYLFRDFARFAADHGERYVRTQSVIEWASEASSLAQRDARLKAVARLASYLQVGDKNHEVPPTNVFGFRKRRRIPYIFTEGDFNRLLQAATQLGPVGSLRPVVYSNLFALLVTTGLRISEALRLTFDDVTPDGLQIRHTKFKKSRLVPLHDTAAAGLDRYVAKRKKTAASENHLFVSLRGRVLARTTVQWTFRGILKTIGLDPPPNGRRPRINDIRHTFAVRALEACPEGRDNVGRHILALSTYLGHAKVSDTFWYLEATPQLMQDIVAACQANRKGGGGK